MVHVPSGWQAFPEKTALQKMRLPAADGGEWGGAKLMLHMPAIQNLHSRSHCQPCQPWKFRSKLAVCACSSYFMEMGDNSAVASEGGKPQLKSP